MGAVCSIASQRQCASHSRTQDDALAALAQLARFRPATKVSRLPPNSPALNRSPVRSFSRSLACRSLKADKLALVSENNASSNANVLLDQIYSTTNFDLPRSRDKSIINFINITKFWPEPVLYFITIQAATQGQHCAFQACVVASPTSHRPRTTFQVK